jgi:hypothetical protein
MVIMRKHERMRDCAKMQMPFIRSVRMKSIDETVWLPLNLLQHAVGAVRVRSGYTPWRC